MVAAAFAIAIAAAPAAIANPASFDPSFGDGGRVVEDFGEPQEYHSVDDIAVLPGGAILAAGQTSSGPGSAATVAKFNPDGELDSSFAGDGRFEFAPPTAEFTFGKVVTSDRAGRVLLAAEVYETGSTLPDLVVVRLDAEGDIDSSFSGDGVAEVDFGPNGRITSLATYRDGRVVAAGWGRPSAFDQDRFAIARLTSSGSPDPSFSENGRQMPDVDANPYEAVEDVALGKQGQVVLAGWTKNGGGRGTAAVVRLHYDGSLDQSFSGDGVTTMGGDRADGAHGVAILPDGRVVLAARVDFVFTALRLTNRGALDRTLSGDGQTTVKFPGPYVTNSVEGIAIRRDGGIVLGGTWQQYGDGRLAFVALRPRGSLDPTFSNDGRHLIEVSNYLSPEHEVSLGRDRLGRIVTAGTIGGDPLPQPTRHLLIRLRGDTSPTFSAKCFGRRPTFLGTARPEEVAGTDGRDVIVTFGGDDSIQGAAGRDFICSGRGADDVFGNSGPDSLFGGPGRDLVLGGSGRDRAFGGPGRDRVRP